MEMIVLDQKLKQLIANWQNVVLFTLNGQPGQSVQKLAMKV